MKTRELVLIALMAALVALTAQLTVQIGPVPHTGQTLGVLLAAILLGPRRGAAALLVYLALGAIGLPVFSGGRGSLAHLLGPTGGFLVSFPLAAWVVGWLAEVGGNRPVPLLFASLAGHGLILLLGAGWFALASGQGFAHALAVAVTPFLLTSVIKAVLATGLGLALKQRLQAAGLL